MSLNNLLDTPAAGTFTLEDFAAAADPVPSAEPAVKPDDDQDNIATRDELNDQGVLGNQKADQPDAVIETTLDPKAQETTLNQDEIEQIPSWDTRIKLVGDTATKVVEMQKVQKDIEGVGTMDQFRSDVIETTFENFYTPTNSRAMFTTFESRTGLSGAQNFMQKRLALVTEALLTEFDTVNTSVQSEMAKDMLESRDFCIYELRDTVVKATSDIQAVCQKLCSGPLILPMEDGTFIDMTSADFTLLKLSDIKDNVPLSSEFHLAFERMLEIWKSDESIRQYIEECMGTHVKTYPTAQTPLVHDGLFLATLLASFGSWTGDVMYNEFVTKTDRKIDDLKQLLDAAKQAVADNADNAVPAISQHMAPAAIAASDLVKAKASARVLGDFAKACATVVRGLAAL